MGTRNNPRVLPFQSVFCIVFQRRDGHLLSWIEDMSGKKMKREIVALPVVTFKSRAEAESELKTIVLPYLRSERAEDEDLIVGW